MKKFFFSAFLILLSLVTNSQEPGYLRNNQGVELRLARYLDSLTIIDTHEHLIDPEILKNSYFLDFMLLFNQNGYDDLISAGMPVTYYDMLFNQELSPVQKWKLIEPYWNNSFNTSFNRTILYSIRNLYGVNDLNESTVDLLSERIKKAYEKDWFGTILRDSCKIKYIIKDGEYVPGKDDYIKYAKRFDSWLLVRSKWRIDSLAIRQLDPIYTLEDFVKSLQTSFEKELKGGMIVVKTLASYYRTLNFEKTDKEAARKVFRTLVNGEENFTMSMKDAKPLQDYMLYQLLDLANKHGMPVAIHTGLQAGWKKIIDNTNPEHLINILTEYPGINFVLYHGSYPYGGLLSAIAKNYRNVYIDMNWSYMISPTYAERYFNEWLEMVPASRLIAFGGDCMAAENVYSELKSARKIITKVLSEKVNSGYISESEAKQIARMILYDNASRLYNLH